MNEIKVMTNNGIEDFIRFNMYTLDKYQNLKLQYVFLMVFGLFSIFLSFFSEYQFILLVIGIVFVSVRFIYPARIANRIKKYVEESPNLVSNGEIVFSEFGIIEVTETTTTNIKWKDIYSFDDDRELVYIFFTKTQAFIINNNLLSHLEMDQLRNWALRKNDDK